MTSTKYTIAAANRITGKSRTTISKHISSGALSVEVTSDGKKLIDASELLRVYGDACNFDREEGRVVSSKSNSEKASIGGNELQLVKAQLESQIGERKNERDLYIAQIENLQDSLAKAQDGHNRATLLLEHHSKKGGDWEQALQAMEEKLANKMAHEITNQQEQAQSEMQKLKDEAAKREERLKRALEAERKKPLWKKIWS